jgi:ABC-type sugar transport system substrate-binding protein
MVRLKAAALVMVASLAVAACGSSNNSSSSSTSASSSAAATSSSASSSTPASSTGTSPLKGKTIAFANFTLSIPEFVGLQSAMVQEAKTLGVNLKLYNNNADPSTTLTNARLIAQAKPALVLEYNPVAATANAVGAQFTRAGVPCIAVNTAGATGCPWYNLRPNVVSGEAGTEIGLVAKQRGWTGANTKVVLFDNAPAGAQIQAQIDYFYQNLTKVLPGLAPLPSFSALTTSTTTLGSTTYQASDNSDPTMTYTEMKTLLAKIPSSDHIIVYTTTDDGDAAALRAVNQSGHSGGVLTVGIVGSATALNGLRDNPKEWAGTASIFYNNWGEYLFAMAQAVLTHAKTPAMTSGPDAILSTNLTVPKTEIVPWSTYYKSGSTTPFKLPPLVPVATGTVGLNTGLVGNAYLGSTGVLQVFGNVSGLS